MLKAIIQPHWELRFPAEAPLDTTVLLALLLAIADSGSIARAAKAVRLSYRYAWGLLREAERLFGAPLLETGRGRGTTLTPLAHTLVRAGRRVAARLAPLLDSLAHELESELGRAMTAPPPALRIDASHGFGMAALMAQLRQAELPVELHHRHGADALAALARRECDLAGFHVPLGPLEAPARQCYARWLDEGRDRLILLARRPQGLMVAPGNPLRIAGLADLTRAGVRFVNRQPGSGTRLLLELMLAEAAIPARRIDGFDSAEFTHAAVATRVASGGADVGVGVAAAARRFGLDFIELLQERYFLALPHAALELPPIQRLLDVLRSPACRQRIDALAGYSAADSGRVLTLRDAFGAG